MYLQTPLLAIVSVKFYRVAALLKAEVAIGAT